MTAWRFGSYDLNSFGVVTVLDEYYDLPKRRSDNIPIPYSHGSVFVPKFYEQRTITFGMTISGATKDEAEQKLEVLRSLLSPSTQQYLYRISTDGSIRRAYASVDGGLNPTQPAPHIIKISIEFTLPDPFLRSTELIDDNTTVINSSPKTLMVTNTGTVAEREPTILLTGPLTNPVITNPVNGLILTYTGVISAGHTVEIGVLNKEYYATHSVSGNVIGNVDHSGDTAFMVLEVGDNPLSVTSDVATTGTVKVYFYPPFI